MATFDDIIIEFEDETYSTPPRDNIVFNFLNYPEGYTVNIFDMLNIRDNNFYFTRAKEKSTYIKGKLYILSADNYHVIDLSNRNIINEIPFPFTGQEPNFVIT